ncbi:pyridoxal phosphate-dependent aminotransferase [Lachnospiraceae bacterium MD1]|uniref:cysteine-S-conjugate beta-lyase n=1 Tax=Variimorphobacter saccharofermentans TaxID=2755051 RepID=A0A839JY49_9FIRM|nr:MalY/PatB family protein [Variimorphobacter saccharofermentans]MBB2182593.1 pyridoxal phosphate-dependent aminotransferase [Variimorphobacter saccharofermentans]
MNYNFDSIIDRRNTNCLKYDFMLERKKRNDLLPLWVADMDFRLPDEILSDIQNAVSHGIFGYSDVKEDYFKAVQYWFEEEFHWTVQREWLIKTPGVVFAIAQAIKAFTQEGDAVMIQQPVYYPFSECIINNHRKLVNNQLRYNDGKYTMDLEDFENKIIQEKVKLFILCSPHNPVGRVWTEAELNAIGDICLKHNVLIVSDEIHCDFTYPGHHHTIFASLKQEYSMNSITCTSPSKTFNMAGLQVSNIFIPNPELRKAFCHEVNASGYSQLNALGLVACKSAYTKGRPWLNEVKNYIEGNLSYVRSFLKEKLPEIKLVEPEGTYLIWLDCSELGLNYKELEDLVIDKANLWLDGGIIFGKDTALFERINIACPRSIVEEALNRLERAIHGIS